MGRDTTIGIRASDRKLKGDLRRAKRTVKHFGKDVETSISSGFKGGFATLGSFAAVGGMTHLLKSGMSYQTTLQRLGDQAKKNKPEIAGLDKQIRAQANAWGLTNEEMIEATAQLVNLQGASALTEGNMSFLAEAMTATGASAANTSRVMSALMDQGVATPAAMREAFDALIEAGDAGNIPFDLMADKLSSILPMVAGLVTQGKQGHAELGGLLQVLGKVTGGDISQVQTLTKAMTNNLRQSRAKLKREGYGDLFDKDGNLRNLYEIRDRLGELGDDKGLIKLITSSEARSAIQAIGQYGDVWKDVTDAAMKSQATQRKANSFMASSAGKWRKAMARIQNKFSELMTPDRIDKVADAAGYLADGLGVVADNIGLVVGAWAAWKGLGLLSYLGKVKGALVTMGGAAGKAGSALGTATTVSGNSGLVTAMFTATYAVGTYVDKITGLSDKLAGVEPADNRTNLQKGRDLEASAHATRDWLQGVQSGDIDVADDARAIVAKRMRGEALTDDERTTLKWESGFKYNEDAQNWESALAESQRFIVPAQNKKVDALNANVRTKARELIDSGSVVSTLRDMALRDNKEGRIDTSMIAEYMSSRGLDAHRRDFMRTGDKETDKRLADDRRQQERARDAELVQMVVKAVENANLQVKAELSIDSTKLTESMANSPAKNRSY